MCFMYRIVFFHIFLCNFYWNLLLYIFILNCIINDHDWLRDFVYRLFCNVFDSTAFIGERSQWYISVHIHIFFVAHIKHIFRNVEMLRFWIGLQFLFEILLLWERPNKCEDSLLHVRSWLNLICLACLLIMGNAHEHIIYCYHNIGEEHASFNKCPKQFFARLSVYIWCKWKEQVKDNEKGCP
jgi:hypothetical protein